MQVWLKPDVLQRLDAYCAFYGIGRGRAIGHLLKGALPDPSWLPTSPDLLAGNGSAGGSDHEETTSLQLISDQVDGGAETQASNTASTMTSSNRTRPEPSFREGDSVMNNSGTRCGLISDQPPRWVPPSCLASGEQREGHWCYAVAWDGQMGFTISYAEDLLRHVDAHAAQGRIS